MRTILRTLLGSCVASTSFWLATNVDRSSYGNGTTVGCAWYLTLEIHVCRWFAKATLLSLGSGIVVGSLPPLYCPLLGTPLSLNEAFKASEGQKGEPILDSSTRCKTTSAPDGMLLAPRLLAELD